MNILDLPDEILFIIINKLKMVDVFYSLMDVNERFDRLVFDLHYVRYFDMSTNSSLGSMPSIDDQVLSDICEKVLPRVQNQVTRLIFEPQSIKHVLRLVDYPHLSSLAFLNFPDEILLQYLTSNTIVHDLIQQVTHVTIDIQNEPVIELSEARSNTFKSIVSSCKRLIELNFCCFFSDRKLSVRLFDFLPANWMSSTLTKLEINVESMNDCLHLLDGRLECLSILLIFVKYIDNALSNIDNTKKLPKLKCFSLTSFSYIVLYDNRILPLLRRMINLEELILYLTVKRRDSTHIDGVNLYNEILIYMSQLNKFTFSIDSYIEKENMVSNEDIQRSFIGTRYGQVDSSLSDTSMDDHRRCHVYSLPYGFEYFIRLDNSFSGGIFHKVRYLMMRDKRPFEHQFFQFVSQCFPCLEYLYVYTDKPQEEKQNLTELITFPHMTFLHVKAAHEDYTGQFLLRKKTHLPNLLYLTIRYKLLMMVTNNFTTDAASFNFAKLKKLDISEPFDRPDNFSEYFPLL